MGYQLGIDLGTTYTAAAVCRTSDRRWVEPEVVTLGSRGATIPSVMFIAPDGSVVVGEAAERRAVTDPDRVVREFKRRIGDPTPVMAGGRPYAPQDLSARLVRWVVDRVAEREGGPADRIAVTHPASWGSHKKDLLSAALAAQGVVVTFLAEPQAAALSYAANERVGPGSTIAVYDFGGGTFDAAVVRKGDPAQGGAAGFGLLGRPQGLERLGGIDFDQAVFEHVLAGMPDAFADLDENDPAVLSAVARLRRDCTEAKEALSSDTEVAIPVMLPAARGSVRMHRSEFETVIRPSVEETVSALRSAVVSAGLAPEQLTAVLLVGGSSRIPLVAQLVSEQLGRPVAVDADPKNAIAKGAALAVSPKPTASWPGVVIPPVPAGPGPAAQGPMPARPPRPGMGPPPPPGGPGIPYGGPYGPGGAHREPPHGMPHREAAPSPAYGPPPGRREPDPSTAVLAQTPVHHRRAPDPEPDWNRQDRADHYQADHYQADHYQADHYRADRNRDDQYDDYYEPEPRRRGPSGLLVGVGALLAVGAVVLALVWWPTGSGTPTDGLGTDSTLPTSAPAESGSDGGSGRDSDSGGGAPAPVAPPADDVPTRQSEPPADEDPPADAEPTDEPTDEPTAEPTEDTTPGGGSSGDGDTDGGTGSGSGNGQGEDPDDSASGAADGLESPVDGVPDAGEL